MFHCLDPWCKQEKPTLVGKGIHEKDIEELTETVQSLERPENVMGGNQGRSGEARTGSPAIVFLSGLAWP